jgi:hypothetical protein
MCADAQSWLAVLVQAGHGDVSCGKTSWNHRGCCERNSSGHRTSGNRAIHACPRHRAKVQWQVESLGLANVASESDLDTQRSSHLDCEASICDLLVDGASASQVPSGTNGDLCWLHVGNLGVGIGITAILPSDGQLVTTSGGTSEQSGECNLDHDDVGR